jgi:cupin 2 domain-containing protein
VSNIFENIPKDLSEEFFEDMVLSKGVKIERIVSYGHTSPKDGWYKQDKDEWVIVLDGEAVVSFKDRDDVRLKKGDYLNIALDVEHKVSWTKPNYKTVWLAVFY